MLSVLVFFLTLVTFHAIRFVNAGLYVVNPRQGSTCHGGEPCTVDWLDDGQTPLLSTIGVVTVGLYTGKQQLVQTIEPVDVSKVHSLTFTPIPAAGPNSDTYYISLISTSHLLNNTLPYAAFSPFFRLDKMTGSFATPNPSAIVSIPIPSSVATSGKPVQTGDVLSTITVGVLSTSSTQKPISTSTTPHTTTTTPGSSSVTTSASSTLTSSVNVPNTTPSTAPSGFSTLVVPPSITASPLLPSSASVSSPPALPSSSSASSSPSSGNTNGAIRSGISRTTGFSVILVALYFLMAL